MPELLSEPELYEQGLNLFKPVADLDAYSWCEKYLHVRDGKWTARRAALLKHWYDIASARITGKEMPGDPYAHLCESISLVTITQIAKTTFILSLIAWLIANHNVEMGLYLSREKEYKRIKKRSIRPMIEKTDILNALLPQTEEARERAMASNDITIGGSLLHLLNGNVVEDLRGMPLEFVAADEIEQLVADIEKQGSPIELMHGRQRTYPFSKLFVGVSSPAALDGHAWSSVCAGSHERLMVVCENCGCCDYLNMNNMVLQSGIEGTKKLSDFPPEIIIKEQLTRWHCSYGCLHAAIAVERMLNNGIDHSRWIAGDWALTDDHPGGIWVPNSRFDTSGRLQEIIPPETRARSGWANALYSTFTTLDTVAADMVKKFDHGKPKTKKAWVNTEKCEPWIHVFTPTTTDELKNIACHGYQCGLCPIDPDYIILSFDQQGNMRGKFWYPWIVRGFQRRAAGGAESWLIACGKAMSESEREATEERMWPCGSGGIQRAADVVSMDVANGNYRAQGYIWASDNDAPSKRVCLWGDDRQKSGEYWKESPIPDPRKKRKTSRPYGVHEWIIHPHHWRGVLQERLMGSEMEPPFHIPNAETIPDYYLRSMTAEEMLLKNRRAVGGGYEEVMVWEPRITSQSDSGAPNRRKDNHWADAEKMCIALAEIIGLNDPLETIALNTSPRNDARNTPDNDSFDDHDVGDYTSGVW